VRPEQAVQLAELLSGAGLAPSLAAGSSTLEVSSVTQDSRRVDPGALFTCVVGAHTDGHAHARSAVAAGAVAVVAQRPLHSGVPEVIVPDTRRVVGPLASAMHRHPSNRLEIIGITGTNGKTTCAHLVAAIARHAGRPAEVIGTLTGARTTPEPTELQARLYTIAEAHDGAVVAMEVSSHALDQYRVDGTRFAAVGFTNLTRDHLDYHRSMEAYFKAKARLFEPAFASTAVIDVDSPYGRLLADTTDVATVVPTGLSTVEVLELRVDRSRFVWRGLDVTLPIGGRFNVANAVLSAELARTLGIADADIANALAVVPPVPGRFERVAVDLPITVIVDYAHTPDGLERVLTAAREIVSQGRVLVVFGCGGERDTAKRPMMGAVAERRADAVYVTADNPRRERAQDICAQIVAGMSRPPELVEVDRRRAIAAALSAANEGDVVIIAGKGHETTQDLGRVIVDFDDRVVARDEAARLGGRP
jgi:UDP-N-acetylmuramoyl-L-alanyl-D-glutamate--2,6-diaminopimelate ligase